ncbi:B domain of TMEM189, localization domain containing protein [Parasponia andersonii]|uniref:B domain of TMEM189, localization domain containing protein n=1 Tax=Parasponia andersonii TaxID=3476 RepID=A0A2P5BRV2_PARAD|nr:B domain of TMEM189, localization domain containing protein [Parasponia andersonii]
MADLWSRIYHWLIDNYGNASTPLFGDQIEEFQGHHMWPWLITKRQFANNLHIGRVVTFAVLPIDLFYDNPIIHRFAHNTKSRLPLLVVVLQDLGIFLSQLQHSNHYRPPYKNNYCIVSRIWNKFLDNQEVVKALEKHLFLKLRVQPRTWSDEPSSEWTHEESQTISQLAPNSSI